MMVAQISQMSVCPSLEPIYLFSLHEALLTDSYSPGLYQEFLVADPKTRRIHKASVRDRVLHQAVYRVLYQIFDPLFIFDSYSCRKKKGVHRSVTRLEQFARCVSKNWRQPAYALKCDIRKFFDSVDQGILLALLQQRISCPSTLALLRQIIQSFPAGLPLGNVTSQIFANIYLNELDQFAKHNLKVVCYLRYCDDFVILGRQLAELEKLIPPLRDFLQTKLNLDLHQNKIIIRKLRQGIDYLGYVVRPYHRVLRTRTKRRILRRGAKGKISDQSLDSYLGILRHCHGRKIENVFLQLCYNAAMSRYYKGKRGKGLFEPQSKEPFKVSRSKIELFLRCPLCFYLDRRLGVAEPPGYPFSLNAAVDHLLKKEFDLHRAKKSAHPLMQSYGLEVVPYQHADLEKWRENFVGIEHHHLPTNFVVTGAVDDVWINPAGELHIVDYKATSKDAPVSLDAEWQKSYKNQMEIYQWLFRQNGFKVSPIGYFVYVNGRRDRAAFDGRLEFDITLLPYEGDSRWLPNTLEEMKRTLLNPNPPQSSVGCDFCVYRQAANEELKPKPLALF